ncbi:MAG: type I-C CRISPR-associated endonuclease Cas1 [Clostridiales bacterium]|nr:type I-C CRISPR-associated endonuclease Cas1 [Clostridiales bacterium]
MKKLLNTLYILDETAYLNLDGENIVCSMENQEKFRIPFSNIESVYCFSYVGCSPAFMGKCVEYGIPIVFISPSGKFLARVYGEAKGNIFLRKRQFEIFDNPPIELAQNTVATKLYNTSFLVKRSLRDYPDLDDDNSLSNCLEHLANGIETVYKKEDLNTIRGIEGNCAKAYFSIFDRLILHQKEDFYVNMRTKRPPLDRVNAVLSFLYTIHTFDYASALNSVGLDSCLGFYHAMRSGRSSLACDLVEETRCIVERLVITMINLKIINESDFDKQVSGAVFLNKEGKQKVITQWQEKKRSNLTHPYLKKKIQFGLLPFIQSNLLAKYIRGEIDEYPCFLMK